MAEWGSVQWSQGSKRAQPSWRSLLPVGKFRHVQLRGTMFVSCIRPPKWLYERERQYIKESFRMMRCWGLGHWAEVQRAEEPPEKAEGLCLQVSAFFTKVVSERRIVHLLGRSNIWLTKYLDALLISVFFFFFCLWPLQTVTTWNTLCCHFIHFFFCGGGRCASLLKNTCVPEVLVTLVSFLMFFWISECSYFYSHSANWEKCL